MSPRTGRPTTDPKTVNMRIRISEKDAKKLEYCSDKTGLTKADVIRKGIDIVYHQLTDSKETE